MLPVEAQPTHWNPLAFATESAAVMPVSLNEPGGVHSLMFGEQSIDAGALGASRHACRRACCLRAAIRHRAALGRIGSISRKRQTPL